jgi:peptidoglycan/xylan/chitin deacetylase (PgdA/CDA1 family)
MAARLAGIPVLMYHRVAPATIPRDAPDRKYWVTAASLRGHLHQIRTAGLRPALLGHHWGSATMRTAETDAVVITFDDGRDSDYSMAFPLLAEGGACAEFFVNTANVGRLGYASWPQIAEMQRAGMSFQSHAHDHLPLLGLSARRLEYQLRTSKETLEDRLGQAVEFLAAPFGLIGRRAIATALALGYRGVCTSRPWPARPGAQVITRAVVQATTTPEQLAALLAKRPLAYLPGYGRMALVEVPKRILLRLRPAALTVELAPERV